MQMVIIELTDAVGNSAHPPPRAQTGHVTVATLQVVAFPTGEADHIAVGEVLANKIPVLGEAWVATVDS